MLYLTFVRRFPGPRKLGGGGRFKRRTREATRLRR